MNLFTVSNEPSQVMRVEEPLYVELDLTWDKATQKHVAGKEDVPKDDVEKNAMSRIGGTFGAARDSDMPCHGECTLVMITDGKDATGLSKVNLTNVARPLWSVGTILDNQPEDNCCALF